MLLDLNKAEAYLLAKLHVMHWMHPMRRCKNLQVP